MVAFGVSVLFQATFEYTPCRWPRFSRSSASQALCISPFHRCALRMIHPWDADSLIDYGISRLSGDAAAPTEVQRTAIECNDTAVLVLAGAGTGKTRVLNARIAYLVKKQKVPGDTILAVSFSSRAAEDIKNSVSALLASPFRAELAAMWVGTFSSLSTRMLKENIHLTNYTINFTVLDKQDQLQLIKLCCTTCKQQPSKVLHQINKWKEYGWEPHQVPSQNLTKSAVHCLYIYSVYQDRLLQLDAMDFTDLVLNAVRLFDAHPQLLQRYQQRFQWILVDELQDTSPIQFEWLRRLGCHASQMFCVGDDDQSIYEWRGASRKNLLSFRHHFGARIISLEQNFRNNAHILCLANRSGSKPNLDSEWARRC